MGQPDLLGNMLRKLPFRKGIPWKPCCAGGGLLLTLALFLLAGAYSTFPGDRSALEAFQAQNSGGLDSAARALSFVGGGIVSAVLVSGMIVYLMIRQRRIDALVVLLSVIPIIVGFFLKEAVGRVRPEYFITNSPPNSLSFPSGHALSAMIIGGLLIFFVEEMVQSIRIRRALQVVIGILILAVGASRVYLGVHWPSDVIGGYLFGLMALIGLFWLRSRLIVGRSRLSEAKAQAT